MSYRDTRFEDFRYCQRKPNAKAMAAISSDANQSFCTIASQSKLTVLFRLDLLSESIIRMTADITAATISPARPPGNFSGKSCCDFWLQQQIGKSPTVSDSSIRCWRDLQPSTRQNCTKRSAGTAQLEQNPHSRDIYPGWERRPRTPHTLSRPPKVR